MGGDGPRRGVRGGLHQKQRGSRVPLGRQAVNLAHLGGGDDFLHGGDDKEGVVRGSNK
jgi:hypothetical protein